MNSKAVFIFLIVFTQLNAQIIPKIEWISIYPNTEGIKLILEDNERDQNGNFYYACGVNKNFSASDFKLIKYNKEGDLLFEINEIADSNYILFGFEIAVDSNENIFVSGTKKYLYDPVVFTNYLTKYSSHGQVLWSKEYLGLYRQFVLLDNEENLISSYFYDSNIILNKYRNNGELLWSKSLNNFGGPTGLFLNNDNIYLTASKTQPNTDPPYFLGFLIQLNSEGEIIRSRDTAYLPICFDKESNMFFNKLDDTITKVDANGDFLWQNNLNVFYTSGMKTDNNSSVIVVGEDYDLSGTTADNYMIKKISENGSIEWIKEFNSLDLDYSADHALDLAINSNDDIYVTGYSQRGITYCYSIKYDEEGNEIFAIKLADESNTQFYGSNIYLGDDESFLVAGNTDNSVFLSKINESVFDYVSDAIKCDFKYSLSQNYPNPFNPTTKIKFTIPLTVNPLLGGARGGSTLVTLKIYNVLGREIRTLINEEKSPSNYEVTFNGEGLPSGVYFYSLQTGDFHQVRKMLLLK
ncbi:MAG: T9SS type A sorting domain-containing protein [bacterium]